MISSEQLVEKMYRFATKEDIKAGGLTLFFETTEYKLFKDILGQIYWARNENN